ncbi:MAG: MATE family efflux transporter [Eubacterium sp.]|nr:MATE family efflux transporter [Eubacterium sp.]
MENSIFQEKRISKAYIVLSLPLVMSMVVSLVYNLADTYFVAQTNNTDLVAGVSLGAPVFTLLMAFGNVFAQGGSSLISRLLGQKDVQNARRVSSFSFYVSIITGAVIGALLLLLRTPMLYLLGATADTFAHASAYYVWLAVGAPAVVLSFIHSNLLRTEGLSKESMMGSVLGTVINIVLDPILISVLGMGAAGAAIATVIGYLCTDIFFVIILPRKSSNLSMQPKELKIPMGYVGQILGIGIPAALVNILQSISIVLTNQFLLPYGNESIAAMGIALKVSMIALLIITGFSFGGSPLFGYYYGAGNRERLQACFHFCFRFLIVIAVILTVFVYIAAPALIRGMLDQESILMHGTLMLRWQVLTMAFVAITMLTTIICQSTGKILSSFILSISRQGFVFVIVLLIASNLFGYHGVICSQAIADIITAGMSIGIFLKVFRC